MNRYAVDEIQLFSAQSSFDLTLWNDHSSNDLEVLFRAGAKVAKKNDTVVQFEKGNAVRVIGSELWLDGQLLLVAGDPIEKVMRLFDFCPETAREERLVALKKLSLVIYLEETDDSVRLIALDTLFGESDA